MLSTIISWLEKTNIFLFVAPYVLLQSFLYFSAYIHSIGGAFYYLAWDPELFPHDIIRTSTLGTATLFYKFIHLILGENIINPYYLFWIYLVSCCLVAWAVYLMAKLVSDGEKAAGILALVLLLIEKAPIGGAYVSIMRTDYNYQHFTLPFVLLAVYFLFREKYLYFGLLMAVSFYFHLKTPAAIAIALMPFLLREIIKNPKLLLSFILPLIVFIPKVWMMAKDLYAATGFTAAEKAEYMQLMIHREELEGSMYFDQPSIMALLMYTALALLGVWSARYVTDQKLRSKIYWCHGGVYFAFAVGSMVRLADHLYGPLGEVVVMGYSRACILGILLTMCTLSVFFYNRIKAFLSSQNAMGLFLAMLALFFVAISSFYYADFLTAKAMGKFAFFAAASAVMVFVLKKVQFRIHARSLISVLLIIALAYTGLKGVMMVRRSYAAGYRYAPFIPDFGLFNPELDAAGEWVRKNTPKDAHFLSSVPESTSERSFCDDKVRRAGLRSIWCQGFPSAYGSAAAFREWKRRRAVLDQYIDQPLDKWGPLLEQEKIDYIFASKDFVWPEEFEKVYQNPEYVVYKIN